MDHEIQSRIQDMTRDFNEMKPLEWQKSDEMFLTRYSSVRPMSRIDLTPADTTVMGVLPSSVRSALTSRPAGDTRVWRKVEHPLKYLTNLKHIFQLHFRDGDNYCCKIYFGWVVTHCFLHLYEPLQCLQWQKQGCQLDVLQSWWLTPSFLQKASKWDAINGPK